MLFIWFIVCFVSFIILLGGRGDFFGCIFWGDVDVVGVSFWSIRDVSVCYGCIGFYVIVEW